MMTSPSRPATGKRLGCTTAVLALACAAALPSAQAAGFALGDFDPTQWQPIVVADEGAATLSWDLTEGVGSPGQGWLVNYLQPRTFSTGSSANRLALIYTGFSHDPAVSGALTGLAFSADVRGYSTSFSFAPLGYLRPVIVQDGMSFSVASSDVTVLLGQYQPQVWSFTSDSNWLSGDGSTLKPDFSVDGSPIQFGLRFSHFTSCNSSAGCVGGQTLTGIDNIGVTLISAVPEPSSGALALAGAGALAFWLRRRKASPST